MPTYQYACKDCNHHFEQVQAFSDPSLTVCPNCGGHLRKVYGSVGVVFKGSGFYRTDSRAGAAGKASLTADHKAESSNGSSSSDSSGASSKPATPAKAAASSSSSSSSSATPAKAAV